MTRKKEKGAVPYPYDDGRAKHAVVAADGMACWLALPHGFHQAFKPLSFPLLSMSSTSC